MATLFTTDVVRFLMVLLVSSTWLVLQLELMWRTVTATVLSPLQRALCVVPPVAAYYAYRLGARRRAALSVLLFVAYLALRRER